VNSALFTWQSVYLGVYYIEGLNSELINGNFNLVEVVRIINKFQLKEK
jgi:hypothetical protein